MSQSNVPTAELVAVRELKATLRAVGDTLRLQILHHLAQHDEMNVSELVEALRTSQPLLSWHLGVLRRARLVFIRRQGRLVWYSLDRDSLRAFRERLDDWLCSERERDGENEGEEHV
jgi:DNA-binding transcriptional ArsR family regulator